MRKSSMYLLALRCSVVLALLSFCFFLSVATGNSFALPSHGAARRVSADPDGCPTISDNAIEKIINEAADKWQVIAYRLPNFAGRCASTRDDIKFKTDLVKHLGQLDTSNSVKLEHVLKEWRAKGAENNWYELKPVLYACGKGVVAEEASKMDGKYFPVCFFFSSESRAILKFIL